MSDESDNPEAFHDGEQALQSQFGVRDQMAEIGRANIRPFMPDQHRAFYAQLPFAAFGAVGEDGRVWASLLGHAPGFIASPDPQHLTIAAWPQADDPLGEGLMAGRRIGLLGIELHTRRRNRANGRVVAPLPGQGFGIAIAQSFGNCPQYIWPRVPGAAAPEAPAAPPPDPAAQLGRLAAQADTFFIATTYLGEPGSATTGVDVSHRGGRAGFLQLQDGALVWPEYKGNFFFNTLGNILADGRAGLIIPDFETGDALQVSGTAEILPAAPSPADGTQIQLCRVRFVPRWSSWRTAILPPHWALKGAAASAAGKL
jgi:predicted pyridoxine 5'-phosphate oxidase superfamily flavin-nucleotide-binding protein